MFRVARLINFSFSSSFFKSKAWSKKKNRLPLTRSIEFLWNWKFRHHLLLLLLFFSFFGSFKMKRIEKSIAYVHISRARIPWNVLHMQHYINSLSLSITLSEFTTKFFSMKYFVYGGMCYLDREGVFTIANKRQIRWHFNKQ